MSAEFQTRSRALKPPGYLPQWHIGVRAVTSRKLVAFISAIPARANIYTKYDHYHLLACYNIRSSRCTIWVGPVHEGAVQVGAVQVGAVMCTPKSTVLIAA